MPSTQYIGKAGHLAAMGELCLRGYNVSMPEIDKGDDVFVVRDETGAMWRLQVKTARGTNTANSTRYQFRVKERSIQTPQTPELHFIFVMRRGLRWRFLILDRAVLRNYVNNQDMGTGAGDYRQFYVTINNQREASCSGINMTGHLEDWETWPIQN